MTYTLGLNDCLIQIGLDLFAEYIYVTQRGWDKVGGRFNSIGDDVSLPDEVKNNEFWYYYGVDMCQTSIDLVSRKYKGFSNYEFVHALIHTTDNKNVKYLNQNRFLRDNNYAFGMSYVTKNGDSELLSMSLDTLLLAAQYRVKVVVMDIEGLELDVIRSFSFGVKPDCFVIESHNMYNTNHLIKHMTKNGYSLIRREVTNAVWRHVQHTESLTFLIDHLITPRTDIVTSFDNALNYITI